MAGKTLGIVGMGRIGSAVARRAQAFDMRIVYYSRTAKPEVEAALGAQRLGLNDLLQQADVVSVHVPLQTSTRHLIGAKELALMKPSAYLVNTARGAVIDQAALLRALHEGKLAGAALDVFENEPEVPTELLGLPNVVLTPHIGTSTRETRCAMAEAAADEIISVLRGERPRYAVNPEVASSLKGV